MIAGVTAEEYKTDNQIFKCNWHESHIFRHIISVAMPEDGDIILTNQFTRTTKHDSEGSYENNSSQNLCM